MLILVVLQLARLQQKLALTLPLAHHSNGRVLADLKSQREGVPDGMKVDREGNLYVTGAGGLWVFDKTGKHLGTIVMTELPANCAWGDKDFRTLYLTARTGLYKIRLKIPGFITYPTTAQR